MRKSTTESAQRAAIRELTIRAVIRAIKTGKPTTGWHGSTVNAAHRRLSRPQKGA
jgi:hypothetical protein